MCSSRSKAALLLAGALAALLLATRAAAQEAGPGPFVPLGSTLDRLVVWALDDGAFPALDPMTRPFRLAAVRGAAPAPSTRPCLLAAGRRAAHAQDSLALPPAGRRVLGWIRGQLAELADSSSLVAEVAVQAYTNGRRDSFRTSDSGGVAPAAGLRATLVRGPIVAVLNPAIDNRLKDDPEYTGFTKRFIAGRNQEAYLAATWERGDLFYGRIARNWGPSLFDGLLVSPSAYPIEQFAGALRVGRFELQAISSRLNDLDSGTAVPIQRWYLAHRLTVNAGRGVWIALTETGVYGGPGQGFDPVFASPLNLALLSGFNDKRRVNSLVGADVRFPAGRSVRVALAGYLDDIQIDRKNLTDRRPTAYGLTGVVTAALPAVPVHVSLGYTRVSALSYRDSFRPDLQYSLAGIGLARNFSDYDQVLLRLEVCPAADWTAALDVSYLRQGADDFRQPFPSDSVLALPGQGFLVSPVRSAPGVRLTVDGRVAAGLELRGEVGATRKLGGGSVPIAALAARVSFDVLAGRFATTFPAIAPGEDRGWP